MSDETAPSRRTMLGFLALVLAVGVLVFMANRTVKAKVPVESLAGTPLESAAASAESEKRPVYIDFNATWCVACKVFAERTLDRPQVRDVLKRVIVRKIDVDRHPKLAATFRVEALPTGVLAEYADGMLVEVDRHEGALDMERFMRFIERNTDG